MDVKVSIIIPVYNAEKYIEDCIKSLLNQTLKDCEFIFVNDGSTDNSTKIIYKYKSKDSRIKIINQKNNGVSIARNKGIENAIGEYIGFVDADDYVDIDMYQKLYNSAKNDSCDLVLSNCEGELYGKNITTKYNFPRNRILNENYIKKYILPYFIESDDLNAVWNKIYLSSLIKKHNIKFPKGIALGEDGLFNIRYISKCKRMKYIDYTGYHYREVEGSATRNIVNKDYFLRALEVYNLEIEEINCIGLEKAKIKELKAIKLIKNVISYTYIYFTPCKEKSFFYRYKYIDNMIKDETVQNCIKIYIDKFYSKLGRYDKFILKMISKKITIGIYFATTYSYIKNKA